ncbi:MAG: pyridoxamine 5'-phosphate oxidase family protein [Anaerolineales bacterium]|nr:pyridoxamine 5'-phosphate oxidase family protein [Anaerolineales bacterium]
MPRDYDLSVTPANQMRRPDYACDDDWVRAFLRQADYGRVATRWEEQPFITPVLFWYDEERDDIYFHTNLTGRMRANAERFPQACFEASRMGKLLPSNVALEFGVQYESAVVFGEIRVVEERQEMERALYGLLQKYFPRLRPGAEYRPITEAELKRAAVLAVHVQSWSGKRNWKDSAAQSDDWPRLAGEWLE